MEMHQSWAPQVIFAPENVIQLVLAKVRHRNREPSVPDQMRRYQNGNDSPERSGTFSPPPVISQMNKLRSLELIFSSSIVCFETSLRSDCKSARPQVSHSLVLHTFKRATYVSTSVPKKQNNDIGDRERPTMIDKAEPELTVAFNKPPLPPVLGPVIVFSLLEMGSSGDDE
ncbi:hypothetical protein NE237_013733 [Protea cynaroides]|uniref:Uncharacterized protein n=1 Tax=Protea cynaroides TaxID=273540 RepID=A0A9Q0H2M5_9MAGN|nr:hypothetical protein NE237_013733 [Protea cynaroides]